MEVSGKKLLSEQDSVPCKPCEDRDCYTRAGGLCGECEVYMCNKCFDTHKQFKVCRDHTLTNVNEAAVKKEHTEDLEKCDRHFKEMIKFYCPQHEQVGCGDCMILEHKTCKVEYIRDKASTYKNTKEFKDLIRGADKCHMEAKEMLSSIKNNKIQIKEIHEKFIRDVNRFKDEMIAHITEVTNTVLKLGENNKTKDIKSMDQLEKENEKMMNEISKLTTEIEAQIDKPNKLFVNAILQKPKIEKLQRQLEIIGKKNKIEMYEFKRDENIERSIKACKQLGTLQIIMQKRETDLHEKEVRPKKTMQKLQASVPPKPQPLLDRQLICKHITVDGDCLSYVKNENGAEGLYVDKKEMVHWRYFEVEILGMVNRGTIAIGVVDDKNQWLWRFQTCDGKMYEGGSLVWNTGQRCSVGDRIGCGLKNGNCYMYVDNGKGDDGLYVNKKELVHGTYLEAEIVNTGERGTIAIGVVRYAGTEKLEWRLRFQASDGKLYVGGNPRENTGKICSVGDRIGCGLKQTYGFWGKYRIVFTRNGKMIGQIYIDSDHSYHAAIGMHSAKEQVRVMLDAKMPNV